MKVPAARPAVRSRPLGAVADQQGAAGGILVTRTVRRRPRRPGDAVGEPRRLEDAHHLAVEMHGAWQRIDLCLAIVDVDRESGMTQQVGEQRADRPAADDGYVRRGDAKGGYIDTQELSASHTRSGVAGMLMCLPPSASTMAFMTEGSEPAQPASPQPLAPSTLVVAGTEW